MVSFTPILLDRKGTRDQNFLTGEWTFVGGIVVVVIVKVVMMVILL